MAGVTYKDTITLTDEMTLGMVTSVEETIRGLGKVAHPDTRRLTFEIEADDLWELREHLCEIEDELQSHGIAYVVDRENVTEGEED